MHESLGVSVVVVLAAHAVPAQDVVCVPAPGDRLDVAAVWSAHPVGFALWTEDRTQLVGYYDAERHMCVAQRALDEERWTVQRLPSRVGWDSHNYLSLAVDADGHVHVVGNLHAQPLVYYRTTRPLDVTSLTRVPAMVGEREQRMTYPLFLTTDDHRLVFRYRDGGSGNGDDLLNVYDREQRRWRRLVDAPLLSGEGRVNGYFSAPERGPDGRFHIVGIWRDTPDCATNHDVSYARSADLRVWERADGTAVPLPLTVGTIDVVDPVPAGGGAINGNVKLGFDLRARPVVSYHRYDEDGRTVVCCARFEDGGWHVRAVGDFGDYRWEFSGGGSIPFEVHVGAVRAVGDALALDAAFPGGSRSWLLDADTLAVIGDAPRPAPELPAADRRVESSFPGMQKRVARDVGRPPPGVRHLLVWETLGPNRDRARDGPLPEPSMLRVVGADGARGR